MKLNWSALVACVCLFGSTDALAADSGMYFDIGGGVSSITGVEKSDFAAYVLRRDPSVAIQSSTIDDKGSTWSASVGYRAFRYFAAEVGYIDLGSVKYRANLSYGGIPTSYKASVSSHGPILTAMGVLPIGNRFAVRGRVGVIFAITEFEDYERDDFFALEDSFDDSSRDLFAGVSAAFNVTKTLSLHLGVDRFNKVGDKSNIGESDVDVLTFGLTVSQ